MSATNRLYAICAVHAALGLFVAFVPAAMPFWVAYGAVLGIAIAADALTVRRTRLPDVTRSAPGSFALGVETTVEIEFKQTSRRSLEVEVFDRPPSHCETIGMPATVRLSPGLRTKVQYRLRPSRRGEFHFDGVDVRMAGPLGLLKRVARLSGAQRFRVLPDFRAVGRYALMAIADRTGRLGIRQIRRRGTGMEFSHLREYREGDLIRQIDWKATSRRHQLISREYEDERDQQVLMMLDCGWRMRARDGRLGHFDHSLNATLLLAHVALRKGDGVAVATFGGADVWVPRQRGPRGINVVLDHVYNLEPTAAPSDFIAGAERVSLRQKKRALVVLVTNLYGDVADEVLSAVRLLRRKHLVLIASLREKALDTSVNRSISDFDDALTVAAGHEFLSKRAELHRELTRNGVMLLDVTPDELSVQLVNRYLEVKRRGEL